jgi:DNA-directed RNA polymerase specialized sigma24 family protein
MSEEVETASLAGSGGLRPDRIDGAAFARLFAAHAAQLLDYCGTLTGSDAAAAAATAAAMSCAQDLPRPSHLLRARLFAIARREALAITQIGNAPPPGFAADGAGAPGPAALAVLGRLPAQHREVLALVYRHGIWPEQLPAVLGVSPWEAYERLAAAEHEYLFLAADAGRDSCPALEDMVAGPLAAVPGSVWQDAVAKFTAQTARLPALPAARPAGDRPAADRPARRRTRRRLGLQLAAAAVLPITAIAWAAIAHTGGSGHTDGALGAAGPALAQARPVSWPSEATPDSVGRQSTTPPKQGTAPVVPILTLLPSTPAGTVLPVVTTEVTGGTHPAPAISRTASASPSVSAEPPPSPSSVASSPSASPSDSAPASPSDSPTSAVPSASPSDSASSTSPAESSSPEDTSVPAPSDS